MSRINPVYRQHVAHYAARHEAFATAHGGDPDWLVALRAEALAGFVEQGFPSPRIEEWRSTNVAPIARLPFELASLVPVPGSKSAALPGSKISACLVNGVLATSVERADIRVESLAHLRSSEPARLQALVAGTGPSKDRGFALLNTAFLDDGFALTIPRNASLESPVYVLIVSVDDGAGPSVRYPRLMIDAEPGSVATVILDHLTLGGESPSFSNGVTSVSVGENAGLQLVIVERSLSQPSSRSRQSYRVENLACRVERDGRLESHTIVLGGTIVRNDLDVMLADEGARCSLRGLFIGGGGGHIDNHTSVDHAMPHGTSAELYKGILAGRSSGVFRGRVTVRPDAQGTDARQSNPNLLIGAGAQIDTRPQLEIYADDVKCSHGSTIGQLDRDALFYLRSRGIGRDDATVLLTRAFANEITDALPGDALRAAIADLVAAELHDLNQEETDARG